MPSRIPVVKPSPLASVGVLRHQIVTDPRLTVIVKAGFSFANAGVARLMGLSGAGATPLLSLDVPSPLPGAAEGELFYASDFAPRKPRVDVLLVGHAYGPGERIEAELAIGGFSRRFHAVAQRASGRIPLVSAHVRDADGCSPSRVGPAKPEAQPSRRYEADFDFNRFSAAPPAQRLDDIDLGAPIRLSGLSPHARTREILLPRVSPRVLLEATYDRSVELDPPCDVLWIDTDRETCIVVWRSVIAISAREVERIVVSMEPVGGARRGTFELRREAPRGTLFFASEPDRVPPEPQDEDEQDELLAARYELLCAEHGVDPSLPLPRYVAIAAELAEAREPRKDVLARHELTEEQWLLEERGWLERMAASAEEGDATLATEMGALWLAEQGRLAAPSEAAITLEEYAAMTAAMEGGEPEKVLGEKRLSAPAFGRIERRFTEAMKDDPAMGARFQRLVEEERRNVAALAEQEEVEP